MSEGVVSSQLPKADDLGKAIPDPTAIDVSCLDLIDIKIARQGNFVPVHQATDGDQTVIDIATTLPEGYRSNEDHRIAVAPMVLGRTHRVDDDYLVTALDRWQRLVDIASQSETAMSLAESADAELEQSSTPISDDVDGSVLRLLNEMLKTAYELRASDIHLDPREDCLSVWFRIDGERSHYLDYPGQIMTNLVAVLKNQAGANINESRLPQSGRLTRIFGGSEVDFRLSFNPSIYGESGVARILDRSARPKSLEDLHFRPALASAWRELLHLPYGMILVCGPTGAGKTTTLAASAAEIARPESHFLIAEDPVEQYLANTVQTSINPDYGLDYSIVVRQWLRHDPDQVMIGEIRDTETAKLAITVAGEGHLLLSTTHANTAAAAPTRLIDLGAERYLVADLLRAVLAQRLVKRLCAHCKIPSAPNEVLLKAAGWEGPHAPPVPEVLYSRNLQGCDHCRRGINGREVIGELMVIDEDLSLRLHQPNYSAKRLEHDARQQGMRSMRQDGLAKVALGLCDLEDVMVQTLR